MNPRRQRRRTAVAVVHLFVVAFSGSPVVIIKCDADLALGRIAASIGVSTPLSYGCANPEPSAREPKGIATRSRGERSEAERVVVSGRS